MERRADQRAPAWKGERVVRDYEAWHRQYDDPSSTLAQRLAIVQRRLAGVVTCSASFPITRGVAM